jgi:hypothetical protein
VSALNVERVSATRTIPGVGRLDFEQTDKRRDYWFLPEGNTRRSHFDSVTGVIRDVWAKPELIDWAAKLGPTIYEVRKDGIGRGKRTHLFMETYLRDGVLLPFSDFEPDDKPFLQGAARFIFEQDPQPAPEGVERLVCHPELRYAGRPDLIATCRKWPSELGLFDYKTSPEGNVYAEGHLQTWAYALADYRCGGEPIARRAIVAFSGGGKYRIVESPDASELWQRSLEFRAALRSFQKAVGERS